MIEIDTRSFVDSGEAFERANQEAARAHETLRSRLAGSGAMAGDASVAEEFAAAYDEAAAAALPAIGGLVDAFATCGRLTSASLHNHAEAENRSILSGRSVYTGALCVAGYVAVLPCTLPASLGGDANGLPGWAAWLLDQVEGFVWPDADTPLLREAASAWRAASHQITDLASYCAAAVDAFATLRSPEVPIAVEVTESVAARVRSIAEDCQALADACEGYADHVEAQRAAILDLVHDLIRDTVLIEGAGLLLGALTLGGATAGATALNAARVAAAAPRLLRILETLRALAAACAAPLRLAAARLGEVGRELSVFRRARTTLASTYDAERLARLARLREIRHNPRLLDADDLRGLNGNQIRRVLSDWPTRPCRSGDGMVYVDPVHRDRQVRLMNGYLDGGRPDPLTHGPYAVLSQNGDKIKIPLEGNPLL